MKDTYNQLLFDVIQENDEKKLREKIQFQCMQFTALRYMRDRNGNTLGHYWILLRHSLPPTILLAPQVVNNCLETQGHLWIKHTHLSTPKVLCQNCLAQDIDGNTYGHCYIIYRQQLPPKMFINTLRNNNGFNMAQLYNMCVSTLVPKTLLPTLNTINFECPVCCVQKLHKCPCLSCKHCVCLDCWLHCKGCPVCRAPV